MICYWWCLVYLRLFLFGEEKNQKLRLKPTYLRTLHTGSFNFIFSKSYFSGRKKIKVCAKQKLSSDEDWQKAFKICLFCFARFLLTTTGKLKHSIYHVYDCFSINSYRISSSLFFIQSTLSPWRPDQHYLYTSRVWCLLSWHISDASIT